MYISSTNSTNTLLKELLAKGDRRISGDGQSAGLFYIRAGYQTAGRGQTGNGWESEEGKNLLCSILLPPRANLFELNIAVSVAVYRAVTAYGVPGTGLTIKWPNDIYWQDRKLAGILIENAIIGSEIKYSIAGIGLNVNQTEWHSDAPNPVSMKQITGGNDLDPDALMERLLEETGKVLEMPEDEVWDCYKAHLYRKEGFWPFVEREVSVTPTMNANAYTNAFMARIKEILPTGEILLQDQNGKERKYHFKQVRYVV